MSAPIMYLSKRQRKRVPGRKWSYMSTELVIFFLFFCVFFYAYCIVHGFSLSTYVFHNYMIPLCLLNTFAFCHFYFVSYYMASGSIGVSILCQRVSTFSVPMSAHLIHNDSTLLILRTLSFIEKKRWRKSLIIIELLKN